MDENVFEVACIIYNLLGGKDKSSILLVILQPGYVFNIILLLERHGTCFKLVGEVATVVLFQKQ